MELLVLYQRRFIDFHPSSMTVAAWLAAGYKLQGWDSTAQSPWSCHWHLLPKDRESTTGEWKLWVDGQWDRGNLLLPQHLRRSWGPRTDWQHHSQVLQVGPVLFCFTDIMCLFVMYVCMYACMHVCVCLSHGLFLCLCLCLCLYFVGKTKLSIIQEKGKNWMHE